MMASFDWKSVLGSIAPKLATALGSPVAGAATAALLGVFGITATGKDAQSQLADKIQNATAEDLLKLQQAEQQFQLDMEKLGVDLEKIAAEDRDSARKREAATGDSRTPQLLALFAIICFVGLLIAVLNGVTVADGMKDTFLILVGAAIATFKDVYGYYFGSSSGSHKKDATIHAMKG